jgi:hypothetical protein
MRRRLLAALPLLALALPAHGQVAQPPAPAQPASLAASAPAPASTAPVAPPAATPDPLLGKAVVVVMTDQQRIAGTLVSRDATKVVLTVSGARMEIPASSVYAVAAPETDEALGARAADPNRTRYLYSPSGFMLRAGEGYLSQSELIVTSVMYGVTDHLTLGVGSSIPFWFGGYVPLVGTVKVGGSPTDWLHLAGGVQAFTVFGAGEKFAAGFIFGTVTLGTEDLNISVSGGPPWAAASGTTDVGSYVFSISGNWRMSRTLALVTENWLLPVEGKTEVVDSLALRFIGKNLAVDAGFIFKIGETYPIPWLDFTWHWDR